MFFECLLSTDERADFSKLSAKLELPLSRGQILQYQQLNNQQLVLWTINRHEGHDAPQGVHTILLVVLIL